MNAVIKQKMMVGILFGVLMLLPSFYASYAVRRLSFARLHPKATGGSSTQNTLWVFAGRSQIPEKVVCPELQVPLYPASSGSTNSPRCSLIFSAIALQLVPAPIALRIPRGSLIVFSWEIKSEPGRVRQFSVLRNLLQQTFPTEVSFRVSGKLLCHHEKLNRFHAESSTVLSFDEQLVRTNLSRLFRVSGKSLCHHGKLNRFQAESGTALIW